MNSGDIARGQPLFALLALLCGWAGGRLMDWNGGSALPPATLSQAGELPPQAKDLAASGGQQAYLVDPQAGPLSVSGVDSGASAGLVGSGLAGYGYGDMYGVAQAGYYGEASGPVYSGRYERPYARAALPAAMVRMRCQVCGDAAANPTQPPIQAAMRALPRNEPRPGLLDVGQFSLGRVAGTYSGLPESGLRALLPGKVSVLGHGSASSGPGGELNQPQRARRWSLDAWAMVRQGNRPVLPLGTVPASYGSSQAGAVLRFRIDRTSRYRPTAYLRSTQTLGELIESAAAVGLSARPLPSVPVVAAAEVRLTQQAGESRVQPAAMAITELPPFRLPLGLRGEVYAQAGYIGGEYATPFVDGLARIEHGLLTSGRFESRLGGGVWGGAQKGAGRLDVGPTVSLAFPLRRNVFARVSADWRFRVAGDAEPGSGPAVTLSAGF